MHSHKDIWSPNGRLQFWWAICLNGINENFFVFLNYSSRLSVEFFIVAAGIFNHLVK